MLQMLNLLAKLLWEAGTIVIICQYVSDREVYTIETNTNQIRMLQH